MTIGQRPEDWKTVLVDTQVEIPQTPILQVIQERLKIPWTRNLHSNICFLDDDNVC